MIHRLVVDHCHRTGVVRGLLCATCNAGLGYFRESIAKLEGAIAYLRRLNVQPLPESTGRRVISTQPPAPEEDGLW